MGTKKIAPKELVEEVAAEAAALEGEANEVEDAAGDNDEPELAEQAANVAEKAEAALKATKVKQIAGMSETTAQAMLEEIRGLRTDLKNGVDKSSIADQAEDIFNILGL